MLFRHRPLRHFKNSAWSLVTLIFIRNVLSSSVLFAGGQVRHLVNQSALFDVVEILKIHEFNSDVIEVAFLVIFGLTLPG